MDDANVEVVSAEVVDVLKMAVKFSNGATRMFDAHQLLTYPAFKPLEDPAVFNSFEIDHGIVCWADGEIDIAPETMYAMSYAYDCVA